MPERCRMYRMLCIVLVDFPCCEVTPHTSVACEQDLQNSVYTDLYSRATLANVRLFGKKVYHAIQTHHRMGRKHFAKARNKPTQTEVIILLRPPTRSTATRTYKASCPTRGMPPGSWPLCSPAFATRALVIKLRGSCSLADPKLSRFSEGLA